jgi:hypothetical protein
MRRQVVYKFQLYSIVSDEFRTSRRYGTRTAIDAIGGKVIEDSKITIESSELGKDLEGFTLKDFRASSRVGFQDEVAW